MTEEPTESTGAKPPEKRPWWSWLPLVARVSLGLAGITALLVGLRAAWRSDAATPALATAAVLLFLSAVLSPDLEELSAWFKEGGVRYRKRESDTAAGAYAKVSETLELALREEGDDSLRTVIAQIARESTKAAMVEALQSQRESETRPRKLAEFLNRRASAPVDTGGIDLSGIRFPVKELPEPRASHHLTSTGDRVDLVLTNPPMFASLRCDVTGPDGAISWARALYLTTNPQVAAFPNDFPGATAAPGTYSVTWSKIGIAIGGDDPLTTIATDEFEIP